MIRNAVLFACASLGLAGAAQAQSVTAANPQSVAAALMAAGYRAELTRDDGGDPMVKSTSSGSNFAILFYSCTNNAACKTVQFFAGYTDPKLASLAHLNEWNTQHRWGRAYLTDHGSARVEMDVDLDSGGMSRALFNDNLELWASVMAQFEAFIYGK